MSDRTKNIWNDDDGEEEQKPRRHWLRNFLGFLLTLVIVLLVVLAAAWRDGTGLDALRRYFAYGGSGTSSGSGYSYDASSQNRFAAVGNRLAVLSDTALTLLAEDGSTVWSTPVNMMAPAVDTGGGRAVAYDAGGTELYVLDEGGLCYALTANEEEPYLSATLNDGGLLAVTARKKNYKGAVTVYDGKGEPMFSFQSSQRFVTDAYATDDGKYLASVTLGQSGGNFVSNIVLYDMTQTDPLGSCAVSGGFSLAAGQIGDRLAVVCDNCLALATPGGELSALYSFGGTYLREFDLHGDGYAVLLLGRYQSGNTGRLVTVDAQGQELASLDVNEEVRSVSAAGRYIAVLYGEKLVIYNQMLETYATLSGTDRAREALILEDGSALLAASERATRFLP